MTPTDRTDDPASLDDLEIDVARVREALKFSASHEADDSAWVFSAETAIAIVPRLISAWETQREALEEAWMSLQDARMRVWHDEPTNEQELGSYRASLARDQQVKAWLDRYGKDAR